MLKWIAVLVIVVLLGGVAWFARLGGTPGDSTVDTGEALPEPGAPTPAALVQDGDSNGQGRAAPETRQLVPTAPVMPNPPATLPGEIQVHVVSRAGGAPIPDAEIAFLDRMTVADSEWQRAWYQDNDVQSFIDRHGIRLRADERGRVAVPRSASGAIVAVTPGFDGTIDWIGVPQEPVRLVLDPKPDLVVQVVNGKGEAQSGVPVAICLNTPEVPWYLVERRTNATGMAEFTSLDRVLRSDSAPGYAVGFAFPLQFRDLIPILPDALPREPLRLVMPPTGEVVVNVTDETGEPFPQSAQVALGRKKDNDGGRRPFHTSAVERLSRGRAHFPFVGVGTQFDVRVQGIPERKLLESEQAGPSLPGEVVEIELQWSELHAVLLGRAVTSDGIGLGGRRGRCIVEQEGEVSGGMQLQTDATGGFRFIVPQPWREGAQRSATFHLYPQPSVPSAVSVLDLSRQLAPGDNVVGDLVFTPHPLVVEGRVRDSAGKPVLGALVSVNTPGPEDKDTGERSWIPGRDATASTDAEGRFSVYGELGSNELRLRAFRRGYLSVYQLFAAGASGVELTLVPGEDPKPESTGPGRGDK